MSDGAYRLRSSQTLCERAIIEHIYASNAIAKRHFEGAHCMECGRDGVMENAATHAKNCPIGHLYATISQVERCFR